MGTIVREFSIPGLHYVSEHAQGDGYLQTSHPRVMGLRTSFMAYLGNRVAESKDWMQERRFNPNAIVEVNVTHRDMAKRYDAIKPTISTSQYDAWSMGCGYGGDRTKFCLRYATDRWDCVATLHGIYDAKVVKRHADAIYLAIEGLYPFDAPKNRRTIGANYAPRRPTTRPAPQGGIEGDHAATPAAAGGRCRQEGRRDGAAAASLRPL